MLRLLVITLVILIVVPAIGIWFVAQRALPVLDGVVTMSALYRLVTVKFDDRSIPYIEASSEGDAYFVQGYVTAAQRMFQMDILRRTANGQLSEIFGVNTIPRDKLMRTIGIQRLAAAEWKKMPPQLKVSLQSYTRGVNAYLSAHEGKLPLPCVLLAYKPHQWTETDSLAILKYHQYQSDESWQLDDLRQRILDKFGNGGLAPQLFGAPMTASVEKNTHVSDKPIDFSAATTIGAAPTPPTVASSQKEAPPAVPGAGQLFSSIASTLMPQATKSSALPIWGSNAWAVGSTLSETKGALLACDKHSAFSSPDDWHLCSLSSPKFHMAGATIPGVPGIIIGRNQNVAWGATDLKVDGQDLVLEQFSPQFQNKYKIPSGWQAVTEVMEDIPVRFANPLVHKVLMTKDGPLLSRTEDSGVALSWASAEQKVTTYDTLWHINRAANIGALQAALQTYCGSPQTFVYADDKGNIGSHIAGTVCLHGGQDGKSLPGLGGLGTTISQGWLQASNWPESLSFNQLPGSQGSEAFAVADAPFTLSTSSPYKYLRAQALFSGAASASQKVGLPDLALMQIDQSASLAPLVRKELDAAMKNASIIDGPKSQALELLRKWDGNLKADSVPASIYEAFVHATARRLLESKLGPSMMLEYLEKWPRWTTFVEQVLINKPKQWLPSEERTYETFMVTTFSEALKNLKLASGSEDLSKWTWQSCHRASFQDAFLSSAPVYKTVLEPILGVRSLGVGGDADCIDSCNVVDSPVAWSYACNSGPTARLLIDMSDKDKFYANLVLGQSENPLSPFRTDQMQQWLRAEPHEMAFSQEQAEKRLQHKLILTDR